MKSVFTIFGLLISLSATAGPAKPTLFLIPGAGSSADRVYLHRITWPLRLINGDKYFGKLEKTLKKDGIHAQVCPKQKDKDTRTLEERAEDCANEIVQSQGGQCTERKVTVLGHSMGGLIGRLVAQHPKSRDCIHSITTIATPHKGTPIADFSIEHIEKDDAWGDIIKFIGMSHHRIRYLPQLQVDRDGRDSRLFAAQDTPDNAEVAYYSFSESMEKIPDPALEIMRKIINEELIKRGLDKTSFGLKNDGVVPEYSMVYGKYLGHLDVHHFGSACSARPKLDDRCKVTLKAVLPHIRGLYRSIQR